MKACTKCGNIKEEDQFPWRNKQQGKKHEQCKACAQERTREYKEANPEKAKEAMKTWYESKGREWKKEYTAQNKDIINQKSRQRYKEDPDYRMRKILRSRFKSTVTLKKVYKSSLDYVALDIHTLRKWIEYQFDDNMTWENQGSYWDIDHVVPCSHFDLSREENVVLCFHWSNLRPLERIENYQKNNKIDQDVMDRHKLLVHSFSAFNPGAKVSPKGGAGVE